mmetsp:Transcript_4714/g.5154  ORF Transcript_4714/g.5154 Transcript_4714/m.5154 type:complete len:215 (+) Transcript_4714:55-699(+)
MNAGGLTVAKKMAGNAFGDAKNAVKGSMGGGNEGGINWQHYNYPPLCHVIHYDLKELEGLQKSLVKRMNWSLKLLLIILILNFINSVAITIGIKSAGIRILYSVLNIVIFPPVAFFSFYRGYRGLCFPGATLFWYYVTQGILMCLYFCFSIISAGPFNGWLMVSFLFSGGYIFQGIVGILESMLYLGNVLLMAITVFQAHKFSKNPEGNNNIRV